MSLGWQCESALVPRTAKPIKIDDHGKSMLGLKAIVYNKQESLKSGSQKKDTSILRKRSHIVNNSVEIDNRNKSSKIGEEVIEDKVVTSLKRKSELYEKLKSNNPLCASDDILARESLVEFETSMSSSGSRNTTINDKVFKDDILSAKYNEVDDRFQYIYPSETSSSSHNHTYSAAHYPYNDVNSSTRSVNSSTRSGIDDIYTDNTPSLSNGSRVKSQWEKNKYNKQYLDEIHTQTIQERSLLKDHIYNTSSTNNHISSKHQPVTITSDQVLNISDDNTSSSQYPPVSSTKTLSATELRRQLILQNLNKQSAS